jgi:hypothetical protein
VQVKLKCTVIFFRAIWLEPAQRKNFEAVFGAIANLDPSVCPSVH